MIPIVSSISYYKLTFHSLLIAFLIIPGFPSVVTQVFLVISQCFWIFPSFPKVFRPLVPGDAQGPGNEIIKRRLVERKDSCNSGKVKEDQGELVLDRECDALVNGCDKISFLFNVQCLQRL